ncbi:MAG: hypothetical protein ABJA82_12320 [Myxococcales bacterium]
MVAVALPDPVPALPAPLAPPTTPADGGALGEAGSVTASAGDSGRNDVGPTSATDHGGEVVATAADGAATQVPDGELERSGSSVADEGGLSKRERRKRRNEAPAPGAALAGATKTDGDAARSAESPQDPASGTQDPRSGNAPLPPSDGSGEPGKEASAADCALPDKDLARESWRRNWPAVCSLGASGKAFILLPIKGPLEGEKHALYRRPTREARINLAAGTESLLTMKQYKMNRLGFKELRVHTGDDGRSHLRVKLLPGAGDPVFEIKDGYAKITVAVSDQN